MPVSTPIRVVLADDMPTVRALLRLTLENSEVFEVVAEAADGEQAVALADTHQPDVVLLDLAMPVLDGLAAIPQIRKCSPASRIVVLSGFAAERMAPVAIRTGADAYIEKRHRPDELVRRLVEVCHDDNQPATPGLEPVEVPDQRARERFRLAFDHAPVGMSITDLDGHFLMVNDAALAMTGYRREDLLCATIALLAHPDDADANVEEERRLLAGDIPSYQVERRYLRADGTTAWALMSRSILRDDAGRPQEFVIHSVDVSDVKRANDDLTRSNTDLAEFAAVAAHDLRSPLQAISGFADLLARLYGDQLDERGQEFVGWIVRGAASMGDLIDDLLDYTRAGTADHAEAIVDLNTLVAEVVASLGAEPPVITVEPLPSVCGNAGQLSQVFQNLLNNALKFVPEGRAPRVRVSARRDHERWTVAVDDNGIGIDPGDKDRVFAMFERLHRAEGFEGTGIGLSICKRIVERAGGHIWVESAPDGPGTRFCVSFRATAPEAQADEVTTGGGPPITVEVPVDAPIPKRGLPATLGLLLVEDSDAHARLVTLLLEQAPETYIVQRVVNLAEARGAVASAPGCILLDLSLPDSDGLETLAEIRTAAPHIPVVVLTSRDDEALAMEAVHRGAQDYLVKGRLDGESLSRSIRYAVERWTLEARLAEQAVRDPLTGLANRTLVVDRLTMALARSARTSATTAVLYLDIDQFKPVNDRLGHEAGDRVLIEVARRLQAAVRPLDTAGRIGGDEFVIVCEGLDGPTEVQNLADRIDISFETPVTVGPDSEQVSVSIGWVVAGGGEDASMVLRRADMAMYEVKRSRPA